MGGQGLLVPPGALVNGIDAAVAAVADSQAPAAGRAQHHALEQAEPFPGRTGQQVRLTVGPVGLQSPAVRQELVPADVAGVMVVDHDPPSLRRHRNRVGTDLAIGSKPPVFLVAAEDIAAGVKWISQDTEDP